MKSINRGEIILASKSPRRKRLLEELGLKIEICPSDIDEKSIRLSHDPELYVSRLSLLKAYDIKAKYPDHWIIGADTVVFADGGIIGKPGSRDEAVSILRKLSDREHMVYTGFTVCCHSENKSVTKSICTKVVFKNLSDREISWYSDTEEPYDKAGAYGIQKAGAFLVRRISGSYSNVVGLPMCEVIETFIDLNIIDLQDI